MASDIGQGHGADEGMDMSSSPMESTLSLTPLQLHFLRRLNRLLRLRSEQVVQLNGEGVRLIDRGIYSTYCDLRDLGVGNEAQKALQRYAVASNQSQE